MSLLHTMRMRAPSSARRTEHPIVAAMMSVSSPHAAPLLASKTVGVSQSHPSSNRPARRDVKACGQARSVLNLPIDRDLEDPLPGFDRISDALADFAAGKFLVVLDDENRENEGDLIIAADTLTTEAMAYMVEYTSGVICIGMEGRDLDRLRLPLMVSSAENEEAMYTAFTVTVDLREGVSTGISASDRAKTLRALADPNAVPAQFNRPGHIFPLRARPGGVLVRPGHTEASVDLARLAGRFPAGALCEIVSKKDGSMARTPELLAYGKAHGMRCIAIADLIRYRLRHEQLVSLTSTASITTRHGPLTVHTFKSALDGVEHVAVAAGDVSGKDAVLLHVQAESAVADLLGCAPASSSGVPTNDMLQRIAAHGTGVVIYMRNGAAAGSSGLSEEVRRLAAAQQAGASGTAEEEEEHALQLIDYGLAAQMLTALNIKSVSLASDDQMQKQSLRSCGVSVAGGPVQSRAANGASNGHVKAMHASHA